MRTVTIGVSTALLLASVGGACLAVHRMNARLGAIQQQVSVEGNLPFTLTPLDMAGRARQTAFEPVAPPNIYTTGAAFAGKLYLAGPGGIAVYREPGGQPQVLRTGMELPPAVITAFATGRLRGQSESTLLAATHGEGLLMFTAEGGVQQLRPNDAASRDITAMLPLASGDLLLGTRRAGLLLYDGSALRAFGMGFAGEAITSLAGDEGDFWAGTRTHGVLHWHAGELDALDKSAGLPDAQVEDIAINASGVFIGTPLGVAQMNDGHLTRVLAPGLFAHALAVDESNLLIATIDEGLHTVSLQAHASPHAILSASTLHVSGFFRADGTLLGLDNGSLLRREASGGWQRVIAATPQALTDSNISSLSVAGDGKLWIGYFDRGLDVLDLPTNRAQHVEDDHVFCVNRIVPDPQRHTMDVATANGLVLFDAAASTPKVRQVLSRRDGLISDQVTDIAFSNHGMALATPGGMTYFTPTGPQSLYTFQGLANNHVYTLAAETTNGRVMAGTLGGISILNDATVRQNVTLRNSGLKRNWITAIAHVQPAGSAETWFVGTYGGGVVQMDAAGTVTPMEGAASQAVINPNALLATSQHVFAGSLDDGLLVYSMGSHHWSTITAGLPSRNVTALTESNGELYVGTENGIVRIAEAVLP